MSIGGGKDRGMLSLILKVSDYVSFVPIREIRLLLKYFTKLILQIPQLWNTDTTIMEYKYHNYGMKIPQLWNEDTTIMEYKYRNYGMQIP